MIKIDGSLLEGGGQILRISTTLSCILNVPISVHKIRAGRTKPGLRPQHLFGIKLLKDICGGKIEGDHRESSDIIFSPSKIVGGSLYADVQTAGSISLLIQSVLPCALFAHKSSTVILKGGTNAAMAPQFEYTVKIFKQICSKFGISDNFNIDLKKRGFYPRGGGEVELSVRPLTDCIQPVTLLDQGKIISVNGSSLVAGTLPIKLAHVMADEAKKALRNVLGPSVSISIDRFKEDSSVAFGNGSSIILWATTSTGCVLGGSALGDRNLRAENVGANAADELIKAIQSRGCVDFYAQDQIIILMALAKGKSCIRTGAITMHTKTAIYITELLTKAKFSLIEDPESETMIIECVGIGAIPSI